MNFSELRTLQIIRFANDPNAISDGSILDLCIQDADRPLLKHPKTIKATGFGKTIENCALCTSPLPPSVFQTTKTIQYQHDGFRVPGTEVTSFGDFSIQTQYLDYFNSRYKNADLRFNQDLMLVAVYCEDLLVGAFRCIANFCPLCGNPSIDGKEHKDCTNREQYQADKV